MRKAFIKARINIRLPPDWTPPEADELQEYAEYRQAVQERREQMLDRLTVVGGVQLCVHTEDAGYHGGYDDAPELRVGSVDELLELVQTPTFAGRWV